MKNIKAILSTLFVLFFFVSANAQHCNFYYPLIENTNLEFQSFSANDQLDAIQQLQVKKVKDMPGSTEATINSRILDSKNKLIHDGDFGVTCSGTEIKLDMRSLLDPSMMEAFDGMDVTMEVNDIIIPAEIKIGDKLKDASLRMTVAMGGMTITDVTMRIVNRTVDGIETITTPAGTFETFKISHDYIIDTQAMGMNQSAKMKTIEYLTKDKGAIRTETYDENGVLQSYTILTKFN